MGWYELIWVDKGRYWQILADIGRNWQILVDIGGYWHIERIEQTINQSANLLANLGF